MDSQAKIADLNARARKFCEERDWDQYHNAKDLAIGIVTEASELLDHFRFKSPEEVDKLFTDPSRKEQMSDELADILYFVLRLADRYNIDLSDSFYHKMSKNAQKYPIDASKGSNKKYTEFS